jgi:hypothetical protein
MMRPLGIPRSGILPAGIAVALASYTDRRLDSLLLLASSYLIALAISSVAFLRIQSLRFQFELRRERLQLDYQRNLGSPQLAPLSSEAVTSLANHDEHGSPSRRLHLVSKRHAIQEGGEGTQPQ